MRRLAWLCPHVEKLNYSKGDCKNCYKKKSYHRNKHKHQHKTSSLNAHYKKMYGLSFEQVERLKNAQDNRCYICKEQKIGRKIRGLCVDHNHKTGVIRGLLCHRCNMVVGFLETSQHLLPAINDYLAVDWSLRETA